MSLVVLLLLVFAGGGCRPSAQSTSFEVSEEAATGFQIQRTGLSSIGAVDLGEVYEGVVCDGAVTLSNQTHRSVSLVLRSTCGCTVLSEPEVMVPANESIPVPFSLNTVGQEGRFSVYLMARLDDAVAQLPVFCDVKRLVDSSVDFGSVLRGADIEREVRVYRGAEPELRIHKYHFDPELLSVSEGVHTGEYLSVLVSPAEDVPFGPLMTPLRVETDSEVLPVRDVVVEGYVQRPLEVEPAYLALGNLSPGESVEAVARVYSPYAASLGHVVAKPVSGDPTHVEITKTEDSVCEVRVRCDVPEDFTSPVFQATIELTAEVDNASREVRFECEGLVHAPRQDMGG